MIFLFRVIYLVVMGVKNEFSAVFYGGLTENF